MTEKDVRLHIAVIHASVFNLFREVLVRKTININYTIEDLRKIIIKKQQEIDMLLKEIESDSE